METRATCDNCAMCDRGDTPPEVTAAFFRPEANLAIVILADEDDCSLLDPALLGTSAELGPLSAFRCFEHGVVCDPDAPRSPRGGARP